MSSISQALAPLPQQFVLQDTAIAPVASPNIVQLCGPNPLRWGLMINTPMDTTSHTTATTTVSMHKDKALALVGVQLSQYQSYLWLDFRTHGIMVQQAWYAGYNTVPTGGGFDVIEVLIQQ